jgi:S-adenosylmethionine synthetase
MTNVRTAEYVMAGHPDKICDAISDKILDTIVAQDDNARVAIETMGGHGKICIFGEVKTNARVDYALIAKEVLRGLGLNTDYEFIINVAEQSPDIAQGVDTGGAGDQGICVGYYTTETPEGLPLPFAYAKRICEKLNIIGKEFGLGPDGKAQVTVEDDKPTIIVVSVQHKENVSVEEVRKLVTEKVLVPLFGDLAEVKLYINQTGRFVVGGFDADTGLTGRKIVVDAYGPEVPVGGGCFSGKDRTKMDRTGAVIARELAEKEVKEKGLKWARVTLAYVIGVSGPIMTTVETDRGIAVGK